MEPPPPPPPDPPPQTARTQAELEPQFVAWRERTHNPLTVARKEEKITTTDGEQVYKRIRFVCVHAGKGKKGGKGEGRGLRASSSTKMECPAGVTYSYNVKNRRYELLPTYNLNHNHPTGELQTKYYSVRQTKNVPDEALRLYDDANLSVGSVKQALKMQGRDVPYQTLYNRLKTSSTTIGDTEEEKLRSVLQTFSQRDSGLFVSIKTGAEDQLTALVIVTSTMRSEWHKNSAVFGDFVTPKRILLRPRVWISDIDGPVSGNNSSWIRSRRKKRRNYP